MKKLLILVILAVAVAGGYGAMKYKSRGPEVLSVESAPVAPLTIVQTVTATGRIQPQTQVNISADVSAKITKLEVKEGDWVEKGQFLLELDRARYQAAVEIAQANVNAAESNVELASENMVRAQKDYERIKGLFDRDLESQSALDGAYAGAQAEKARVRSSRDEVERARAARKQNQDDLSKTVIYAPISGTISKLNKEVGEIALGSQFQEDVIMVVSNLSGMEALVDVDENDIVSIAVGDTATIEVDALIDVSLEGEVSDIANSAKMSGDGSANQKTEFEVKIAVTVPNDSLRPGMTASADIVTETKDDILGVPIQCVAVRTPEQLRSEAIDGADTSALDALTPDKDGFVEIVFVIADGKAWARQVKTGIQSDSHIEIAEGLSEGDVVVTGNYRAISKDLQHGELIKTETAKPGKKAELVALNE